MAADTESHPEPDPVLLRRAVLPEPAELDPNVGKLHGDAGTGAGARLVCQVSDESLRGEGKPDGNADPKLKDALQHRAARHDPRREVVALNNENNAAVRGAVAEIVKQRRKLGVVQPGAAAVGEYLGGTVPVMPLLRGP